MLDLASELSGIDQRFPVTRLNYTAQSIARAHAEMLAEIEAEQTNDAHTKKGPGESLFPRVRGGCDQ
jgi:hypothetical protein